MNSLIVFEHEYRESKIHISDVKRLTHINEVLKAKVGHSLKVTILNQGLATAEITSATSKQLELELSTALKQPSSPNWHAIIGLSRPPTMKKILEHASSLGVKHFHFFPAALSEKSYATSKIWEEEKLTELLVNGISQSASFWQLPQVSQYKRLSDLPSFEQFDKRILSLGPDTISMPSIEGAQPLVLAFGPERGWTADEDQQFRDKNFTPVSIANSVLRVEIALFAALGQCHFLVK